LPLDASRDVLHFTFCEILVRLLPPLKFAERMAFPAVPEFSRLRQSFFGSADLVLCRGWTASRPMSFLHERYSGVARVPAPN
jgi:hypothetical protein